MSARDTEIRCPKCGAGTEWNLWSTTPGATAHAVCVWSDRAFRTARDWDHPSCDWEGTIRRTQSGDVELVPGSDGGGR